MHWTWFTVAAALCVRAVVPSMSGQWAVGLRGDGSRDELEQRALNIAKQHGLLFRGEVKLVPSLSSAKAAYIYLALGCRDAWCV